MLFNDEFNRSRSMGAIQPVYASHTRFYKNAADSSSISDSGLKVGFLKVTDDNVTPGFHALRNKGVIVNKRFRSVLQERDDTTPTFGDYRVTDTSSLADGTLIGSYGNTVRLGPKDPNIVLVPNVDYGNLARLTGTEARAGIAEPEFNAPVFLAEFSETMRMIHNPMKSLLGKFRRDLKRNEYKVWKTKNRQKNRDWESRQDKAYASDDLGTFSSPKFRRTPPRSAPEFERDSWVEFMGNRWLEAQYGYIPLLEDLRDALSVLRDEPTHAPRYTSRATAVASPSSITSTMSYPTGDFNCQGVISLKGSARLTCRAGVLYEHVVTMGSRTNWDLYAIPEAAWEGLPFSFVVDWVVNIGPLIQALTPKVGVRILAEWHKFTHVITREVEVVTSGKPQPGWSNSGGPCYTIKSTDTYVNRYPWLEVGIAYHPNLFDLGQEKWRNRTLNVAAAMTQLLGPVRRKA